MPAPDNFANHAIGLLGPLTHTENVTPADVDLSFRPRAIKVDQAAVVTYKVFREGAYVTRSEYYAPGVWHPVRVDRITAVSAGAVQIGE